MPKCATQRIRLQPWLNSLSILQKLEHRLRQTGGWMRRHFIATMRLSGRRLRHFWALRLATCWSSAAVPDSTRSHSHAAPLNCSGGLATFSRRISRASPPGGNTKRSPIYVLRNTSTSLSPTGNGREANPSDRKLTAILCINVLHISPWRVSQNLFTGAGRLLRDDGRLFLYGPFMHNGAHTAPSNAAFDATLRAENQEWGVRDIRDLRALADQAGLSLTEITAMPANNLVLAFARALRQN